VRDPTKIEMFKDGASEAWNDVFMWGEDKFMGRPDNTTMLQTKKSARQIYAEAFMEEETGGVMGNMGGKKIYDEIDDVKKTIVKPEDDEAEDEEKVENLDEPTTAEEKDEAKAKDLDDLLGGDDDEAEEDGEELYENLDIPEEETPVIMPENPESYLGPDIDGLQEVGIDMSRAREWERLGAKNGYIDHEGKYHAPNPTKMKEID